MDRIFSARLDERVVDEIDRLSRRLGISKKQLVEEAIRLRAGHGPARATDVWQETAGAWQRDERPTASIQASRRAFEHSMHRHAPAERRRARRPAAR